MLERTKTNLGEMRKNSFPVTDAVTRHGSANEHEKNRTSAFNARAREGIEWQFERYTSRKTREDGGAMCSTFKSMHRLIRLLQFWLF